MKLWLIKLKEYNYDEYDAFVVAAESKERAWEVIKLKHPVGRYTEENVRDDNIEEIRFLADDTPEPEGEVLGSYNAG
jgi:hypothetical protein